MAPMTTPEEVGEGPEQRWSARRQRRRGRTRSSPPPSPTQSGAGQSDPASSQRKPTPPIPWRAWPRRSSPPIPSRAWRRRSSQPIPSRAWPRRSSPPIPSRAWPRRSSPPIPSRAWPRRSSSPTTPSRAWPRRSSSMASPRRSSSPTPSIASPRSSPPNPWRAGPSEASASLQRGIGGAANEQSLDTSRMTEDAAEGTSDEGGLLAALAASMRAETKRSRGEKRAGPSEASASLQRGIGGAANESLDTSHMREDAAEGTSGEGGLLAALAASMRAETKRSRGEKRVRASEGCMTEETAPRRSKRWKAETESASAATEQGSSSEASSAVSSPVRIPYIPRTVIGVNAWGGDLLEPYCKINPAVTETYRKHKAKHSAKCRNQLSLVTLDESVPHSRIDAYARLQSIRESVTQMVLKVAGVVFGLSSYIDGNLLKQTSGFLIEWDEDSKQGIILTSTLLFRSKSTSFDEWLGTDEYAPNAEVHVHLLDKHDTVVNAELIHYDKHYRFALFKIKIDLVAEIPSFSEVEFGQEVLVLGRDGSMHLSVDYGTVPHKGPSRFERYHYMFTHCEVNQCCPGGPVIDFSGRFLGMVNLPEMAFTPSSIILKCLHMLKRFDCIPRLHIGMKFSAIKFLDPVHREKIIRKCSIDTGLIVTKVSEGSMAEKVGIRTGDIIKCWNGERVSTTVELESLLLCMSEKHLNNGGDVGSNLDVPVDIFHVRTDSHRTRMLTVKVTDDVEVFANGEYAITAEDCAMASEV